MTSRKAPRQEGLAILLGSFGFTGFFPVAPATFASAVATGVLAFVLPLSALSTGILVAVLFVLGVWACGRMEHLYGEDPSAAVLDEVCGMAITLGAAPITPATLLLGFLLFRVFDILKLPPGRALERLHGGWGIMLDDVMAGVYAAAGLQVCLFLWPEMQLRLVHGLVLAGLAVLLFVLRKPLLRKYGKPRTRLGARRQGDSS
jgi:phosphatidylglycerophosphatase A